MTQALYAHMNNKTIKKKRTQGAKIASEDLMHCMFEVSLAGLWNEDAVLRKSS
jgi:hypothetical protein